MLCFRLWRSWRPELLRGSESVIFHNSDYGFGAFFLVTVFPGGAAYVFQEGAVEGAGSGEAYLITDFRYAEAGFGQQAAGFGNAQRADVIAVGEVELLGKKVGNIEFAQVQPGGHLVKGYFLLVMADAVVQQQLDGLDVHVRGILQFRQGEELAEENEKIAFGQVITVTAGFRAVL